MCDNSAYEFKEAWNPEKLIELASKCGAHAIVLPDYPFQPASKTIDAAVKYIPMFKDAGFQTFFVPQSERGDLDDWVNAYEWASDNPEIDIIGMSILGIPNAMPNIDPAFARVVMVDYLQHQGLFDETKHHHFLGLNAGPKLEIPSLIRMNALTTIDSSGPIWSAILGHTYDANTDSLQSVSKIKMPVQFNLPMTKDIETKRRIQHNIDLTLDMMKNATKEQVWYAVE